MPARRAGRAARRAAGSFPTRRAPRADIVEAAHALGLNLRYVPSMRNGAERSDRGNAILSDLPLSHAWAFELPLVLERRVPLAASLRLAGGPVQLVSGHLDPRGPPGAAWLGVGRASEAGGASGRPARRPTWSSSAPTSTSAGARASGPGGCCTRPRSRPACPRPGRRGGTRSTRSRGWCSTICSCATGPARVAHARVERLDEHPHDRGPLVFGSDHHPLLARIDLTPEAAAHERSPRRDLPWWAWLSMVLGVVALVSVIGALFLPDWKQPNYTLGLDAAPGSEDFVGAAGALLNIPVYQGGAVTLLQNGDAFYPVMLDAIRGARETITFETYIFEPDEIGRQFMDAFMERARAGIEVRVLVDGFGSLKLKRSHRDELRGAGVKVERFRPLNPKTLVRIYRRTHRRAIVIDGRVGFTGGAAVSKKWAGDVRTRHEWRDSMTRVTGPAVGGIQSAFVRTGSTAPARCWPGRGSFPRRPRSPDPAASRW